MIKFVLKRDGNKKGGIGVCSAWEVPLDKDRDAFLDEEKDHIVIFLSKSSAQVFFDLYDLKGFESWNQFFEDFIKSFIMMRDLHTGKLTSKDIRDMVQQIDSIECAQEESLKHTKH